MWYTVVLIQVHMTSATILPLYPKLCSMDERVLLTFELALVTTWLVTEWSLVRKFRSVE
jgi:hypothetical protein